jgi:hypothetical protein
MDVLVHYPTRGRPKLFRQTLSLYLRDPTPGILVTLDADDPTMNCAEMLLFLNQQDRRVDYRIGHCRTKVDAVNDGVGAETWDLLITASDDMIPQRHDYAQRIAGLFEEFFPDGDGVLHLNDGRNGKALNTICICGRPYYDRFGYVYRSKSDFPNDGYISVFCDNEWQEVSEQLGRAIYVNEIIIAHDWIGGTHPSCKVHQRNESFHQQDYQTYRRRKAAGFPT